jgi:hypothetical protein
MGESLIERDITAPSPEERVFGGLFTFRHGCTDTDSDMESAVLTERVRILKEGGVAWLPRFVLNADNGVAAQLFKASTEVALLHFEYDTQLADVYTTSPGGVYGDTSLCSQIPFDDAVVAAERYAAGV